MLWIYISDYLIIILMGSWSNKKKSHYEKQMGYQIVT